MSVNSASISFHVPGNRSRSQRTIGIRLPRKALMAEARVRLMFSVHFESVYGAQGEGASSSAIRPQLAPCSTGFFTTVTCSSADEAGALKPPSPPEAANDSTTELCPYDQT